MQELNRKHRLRDHARNERQGRIKRRGNAIEFGRIARLEHFERRPRQRQHSRHRGSRQSRPSRRLSGTSASLHVPLVTGGSHNINGRCLDVDALAIRAPPPPLQIHSLRPPNIPGPNIPPWPRTPGALWSQTSATPPSPHQFIRYRQESRQRAGRM